LLLVFNTAGGAVLSTASVAPPAAATGVGAGSASAITGPASGICRIASFICGVFVIAATVPLRAAIN
jgi:hypothetical protein